MAEQERKPTNKPSEPLTTLIAKTINRADVNFFNENYSRQADAVIKALKKKGYAVVPDKLDEELIEFAIKALKQGRHRPADVVRDFYQALIKVTRVD